VRGREPVGEVKDHAGEKARFGKAKKKRKMKKLVGPLINAKAPETRPQLTMTRAILRRAPTRSRIRLLGTSNMK